VLTTVWCSKSQLVITALTTSSGVCCS